MQRLPELDIAEMNDTQRLVCEEILSGRRKKLPAPVRAWIYRPELARRSQLLGAYARYETCLPPHLSELAILITAKFWLSEYEWYAHKREALAAGIEIGVIDAIEAGQAPQFKDEKSKCIFELVTELLETRTIGAQSYEEGLAILGRDAMIDLVAISGYYSFVAMTLNAFAIKVPEGEMRPQWHNLSEKER